MDCGGITLEEKRVVAKLIIITIITNRTGFSIHIVITGIMMMIAITITTNPRPLLPLLAVSVWSVL